MSERKVQSDLFYTAKMHPRLETVYLGSWIWRRIIFVVGLSKVDFVATTCLRKKGVDCVAVIFVKKELM